jgi:uncharacterized SAM-binding protein YcdF (DUF218 family)
MSAKRGSRRPASLRRRLKILALSALVALGGWLALLGTHIWRFGQHDQAAPADCIIVLGAAVQDGQPSPVFAERIRHGVNLFHAGMAPVIIFTGGLGDADSLAESRVASDFAVSLGVPASAILREENSRTTRQNLLEARTLMHAHGFQSALIVSDPLHLRRSLWMAEDLGITAAPSPTPTSRYRSLGSRAGFLARELYFCNHYLVTGH